MLKESGGTRPATFCQHDKLAATNELTACVGVRMRVRFGCEPEVSDFRDIEGVLRSANGTEYGLASGEEPRTRTAVQNGASAKSV